MIKVAQNFEVIDKPKGHKTHTEPVPYLGGLAMVIAVAFVVFISRFTEAHDEIVKEILIVSTIAFLFAFLGLVDDLKELSPMFRLATEICGAMVVTFWAARADTALSDSFDIVITVIWIVGVINAVNMLDHQDGLAAGTTAISSLTFGWIAWQNNQIFVPILCGALCGAALGLLRSNFHPARIYMGDSGAYFIGFILAYAGIKMDTSLSNNLSHWIAPIVIAVPMLDSTLVVLSRLYNRKNPLTGGRDHTSHRLMRLGKSKQAAVMLLYFISIVFCLIALISTTVLEEKSAIVLGIAGLLMVVLWLWFWTLDGGYSENASLNNQSVPRNSQN